MDWDRLRIFHAVAKAGSFTAAGNTLHLSQSALSRQIATLEDSLGAKLFQRHARGLRLTEQGEILYRAAKEMAANVRNVEAQLSDVADQPRGDLSITTTVGFGSTWLTPRLGLFTDQYPEVNLHLILTDQELDLIGGEAHAAIRLHSSKNPGLIQRRLITIHNHLYAGREYLDRRGAPRTAQDLDDHDLVVYGEPAPALLADVNWPLTIGAGKGRRRTPVLQVNNVYGVYRAVQAGIGIGSIPDYMVEDSSGLVRILPDQKVPTFPAYFLYPEVLRGSKRIRVFIDFLLVQLRQWAF